MFKVKVMEVKDGPRMDFRWMETEQDVRDRRPRPQAKGMLVEQHIKCKWSLWERIFGGAMEHKDAPPASDGVLSWQPRHL